MRRVRAILLWLWKVLPISHRYQYAILWLTNTKFLVGVVGVIFDDQDRLLVLKHTYRNRFPWGLPGGWADGSERLEMALERELREETGFAVAVGEPLHVRSGYPRPQVDVYFLCEYLGGTFQPNAEISEMGYFALDELPPGLLPYLAPVLERGLALRRARRAGAGPGE